MSDIFLCFGKGRFAALGSEDFGDIYETWPGRQFLQGHRQPTPPIGVLVGSGWNIHRIGLIGEVVDLRHRKNRRSPGEESVRCPGQDRDVRLAILRQQPLSAERL
jgi:hypothetical protein